MDLGNVSRTVELRPPIVVVLGHVDHGKTTLLDFIRKTNIASSEAGGITQSIGASVITTKKGKRITFIDTPGHAAFTSLRVRGTRIADIAVLVVAANDGVKPQTKEALEYILSAKIPFIVAATKIDLPSVSIEKVRSDLEKEKIFFEGKGGDVPWLAVSGKTGQGVEELLEMILLISELYEIKGDRGGSLDALVFETGKDKSGVYVNVIVRNGSLKRGEKVLAGGMWAKIRGLFDWNGHPINEVLPGEPARILGFPNLPEVGSKITKTAEKYSQETTKESIKKIKYKDKTPILIKAKNTGALEALISNLPEEVYVADKGVGDLTESDVFMAKSTNSKVYLFESKIPSQVAKLAQTEGVKVKTFNIIYKLLEEIIEDVGKGQVTIKGKADILKIFPFGESKVAGCRVMQGTISVGDNISLLRSSKELGQAKIISMKKEKQDITSAKQGEECGIVFMPQVEFGIGDVILSVIDSNSKEKIKS